MRCQAGLATMAVVATLVAACGSESTSADDPAPACPSYADVGDGPGADGVYSDFIVGVADGTDGTDLAASLDEVGERLCLRLTPGRELATGAVLVTSDRPLDAAGQARLIAALQKVEGVRYAEPDAVVTPEGSGDQSDDLEDAE